MMCKIRKKLTIDKVNSVKKVSFLAGLTLLELVIVVVIVGIIASFAIPGYLGVRQRAEGRGASTQVRLIHTAVKVSYLESSSTVNCWGYGACNSDLNLDLPNDDWVYSVSSLIFGSKLFFTVMARKGTCTYSMTQDGSKPVGSPGCIFTP